MIYLALVLLAIYVIYKLGMGALVFVLEAFDSSFGFGCLSLIVVAVLAVIVLAIAC